LALARRIAVTNSGDNLKPTSTLPVRGRPGPRFFEPFSFAFRLTTFSWTFRLNDIMRQKTN
jgi:hypothetical protein